MYNKLNELRARKEEREGGFTLIELLVVVVIIGILIAIAIPLYLNYQKGAKDKSAQSDLRAAVSAINQCYTDNGNTYPTGVTGTGPLVPTGTGTPNPCANDSINLSSGTAMAYTALPSGCDNSATPCTGFYLADSNSGGHRTASAATLAAATAAGGSYYFYSSDAGGSIQ